MKVFLIPFVLVGFLFAWDAVVGESADLNTNLLVESLVITTPSGGEYVFDVEVPYELEEQRVGLMNREEMPRNHGMLFVAPYSHDLTFWMKDTLIPLDMLFITANGVVHHVHHNAKPMDETRITADAPSKAVLEINGGVAEELGIVEGSMVSHSAFE